MLVKLPDVPVMATLAVPVVAVLLAVSVKVLMLVALVGLKDAVIPLGSPTAVKLTLPLKPFSGFTVITLVPLAPCVNVRLLGEAEMEKLGTGAVLMVRERVVVLVRLPEVPVMVTLAVPVVAVLLAVSVKVLALVVLDGAKAAVTPLGIPEADNVTLSLKPFCGMTVTVLMPLEPCVSVTALEETDSAKLRVVDDVGQLFTKFATFTLPIPVAKSHPVFVPYAGLTTAFDVDRTP